MKGCRWEFWPSGAGMSQMAELIPLLPPLPRPGGFSYRRLESTWDSQPWELHSPRVTPRAPQGALGLGDTSRALGRCWDGPGVVRNPWGMVRMTLRGLFGVRRSLWWLWPQKFPPVTAESVGALGLFVTHVLEVSQTSNPPQIPKNRDHRAGMLNG